MMLLALLLIPIPLRLHASVANGAGVNLHLSGRIICPSGSDASSINLLLYAKVNNEMILINKTFADEVGAFTLDTTISFGDHLILYELFGCKNTIHMQCLGLKKGNRMCEQSYAFLVHTLDIEDTGNAWRLNGFDNTKIGEKSFQTPHYHFKPSFNTQEEQIAIDKFPVDMARIYKSMRTTWEKDLPIGTGSDITDEYVKPTAKPDYIAPTILIRPG